MDPEESTKEMKKWKQRQNHNILKLMRCKESDAEDKMCSYKGQGPTDRWSFEKLGKM